MRKQTADLEFPLTLSICFYVPLSPSVFLLWRMKTSWSPGSLRCSSLRAAHREKHRKRSIGRKKKKKKKLKACAHAKNK